MTGSGENRPGGVSGNTFNDIANFQVGEHNTMLVHTYVSAGAPLDLAADELARAVRAQWQEEAGLRRLLDPAPLPVRWRLGGHGITGPVGAATGEGSRARFAPVPGLTPVTGERLRAGGGLRELHDVYGGLASGRLLLIGPPAAGKTAAAVLLLLEALAHREEAGREDRARTPVPVLLSLEGWDAAGQTPVDWVVGQLARAYTQFRGRGGREQARALVTTGRIALFLDGLDEADERARADIVGGLEPAPFRLVLLSRTAEAVATARKARLGGAVALELEPVRPADAADYLLRPLPDPPPRAWRAISDHLLDGTSAGRPVARALTSPLAVALLRDAYADDGPVDELLDATRFPGPRAVEDHLLDRAVTAAYTARPGYPRPRYTPQTAERTLRFIARRLTREGTRDLRWWHIPAWVAPRTKMAGASLLVGALYLALGFCVLQSLPGWAPWLSVWAAVTCAGLAGMRVRDLSAPQRLPSAGWRDIFPRGSLLNAAWNWFAVTLTSWLLFRLLSLLWGGSALPLWLCAVGAVPAAFHLALAAGRGHDLVVGIVLGPEAGYERYRVRRRWWWRPVAQSRSVGSREVWRHHIGLRLALGVLTGLSVGLFVGVLFDSHYDRRSGVVSGLCAAVLPALMSGPLGNLAVITALTAVELRVRLGTPVRLMSFLEDARRRNLLRATGPVYQFRHARLQERLAVSSRPESGRRRTPPGPPPY
ncbi:hypothetical protein ACWC2T_01650 [Streptomyces sp. NPDC001393]